MKRKITLPCFKLQAPGSLSFGNQVLVLTYQEAGCVPSLLWTIWKRENYLAVPGDEPRIPGCPASSLVTTMTALFWLLLQQY
jgi:hypothetical protein